ncbi:unnamed protein product, partial [marine sediment metagenome]
CAFILLSVLFAFAQVVIVLMEIDRNRTLTLRPYHDPGTRIKEREGRHLDMDKLEDGYE